MPMYLYMYMHMYVYIYIHMHLYIYMYIYISDGVTIHCLNYHASFIRRSKLQIVGLAIKPYRDVKFCFRA